MINLIHMSAQKAVNIPATITVVMSCAREFIGSPTTKKWNSLQEFNGSNKNKLH